MNELEAQERGIKVTLQYKKQKEKNRYLTYAKRTISMSDTRNYYMSPGFIRLK